MYLTPRSLGKNLTDTVVTRANATLVTDGPYMARTGRFIPRIPKQ